mmetsp:Transcript_15834/g.27282  ORF Transcript_15834/g.27282 Transcript_15834/m.27282 type:complete len:93 (+) Transcript_15834:277-555(+)
MVRMLQVLVVGTHWCPGQPAVPGLGSAPDRHAASVNLFFVMTSTAQQQERQLLLYLPINVSSTTVLCGVELPPLSSSAGNILANDVLPPQRP